MEMGVHIKIEMEIEMEMEIDMHCVRAIRGSTVTDIQTHLNKF